MMPEEEFKQQPQHKPGKDFPPLLIRFFFFLTLITDAKTYRRNHEQNALRSCFFLSCEEAEATQGWEYEENGAGWGTLWGEGGAAPTASGRFRKVLVATPEGSAEPLRGWRHGEGTACRHFTLWLRHLQSFIDRKAYL